MPDSIHEHAAKGFEISTDAYDRGRPEYPIEAVDYLISELKFNELSLIADLGAGTGKLTKILCKSKAKIVAIEPVEAMRRKFSSILPDVEILDGTAERIPLKDESVDAVVAAQAFHWFDGERALKEIHRVLKPGGKLGLIWNARDESIPWVAELTQIIDPYERGAPRYKSGNWRKAFDSTSQFSKLTYSRFGHVQRGDVNTIVDRVSSISFIASLQDEEKKSVLNKVRRLLDLSMKELQSIELPYRTDVFICSKL